VAAAVSAVAAGSGAGRPRLADHDRYYHYTILLARILALFGETRGMVIRINNEKETVNLTVY
jgi:hypothetical protein